MSTQGNQQLGRYMFSKKSFGLFGTKHSKTNRLKRRSSTKQRNKEDKRNYLY